MNRNLAAMMIVILVSIGLVGCEEKSTSTKQETKISTPGGTTTVTTEREVKKTGENPPNVSP